MSTSPPPNPAAPCHENPFADLLPNRYAQHEETQSGARADAIHATRIGTKTRGKERKKNETKTKTKQNKILINKKKITSHEQEMHDCTALHCTVLYCTGNLYMNIWMLFYPITLQCTPESRYLSSPVLSGREKVGVDSTQSTVAEAERNACRRPTAHKTHINIRDTCADTHTQHGKT